MKYAFQMGSDATIYTLSFIKIGSGSQELIGQDSQIHRHMQCGDCIGPL
jgi:hypothetical protein